MPFLAVASAGASVAKAVGVSFKKPSPRYHGGPLFGTLNGFLSRIASGDVAAIREVDTARRTSKDKGAWETAWQEYVKIQPLTEAQRAVIAQLEPGALVPAARTGAAILASPGAAAPSALSLVTEPLRAALDDSTSAQEAAIREAAAQTAERVGVGGGALLAGNLRGSSGPLDTLIEFSQKPGGTLVLVVGAVALVAGIAFFAGRH